MRNGDRAWTPAEDAAVRARYPAEGSAPLARDLGRGRVAVRHRAQKLGLRLARYRRVDQGKAVALWQAGHSSPEVARRLGCSHAGVYHALVRAGAAGPGVTRDRQAGTANPAFRRWLRQAGYRDLLHRRNERWAYESELQWPGCGCLTPGQRRVLAALGGFPEPPTSHELADALGLTWNGQKGAKHLQDVMKGLKRRGLVARVGTRSEGKARHALFSLAGPALEAHRLVRERGDLR